MFVSFFESGSNIDDLMRIYLNNVEWVGWHFPSYATVVILLDPLPNPILFVDKLNARNTIQY